MWLLQQSGISQRSHYIADRRRTHSILIIELARYGLRRNRLPGRNIQFDDRVEDQPVARTDPKVGRHCPPALRHSFHTVSISVSAHEPYQILELECVTVKMGRGSRKSGRCRKEALLGLAIRDRKTRRSLHYAALRSR